MKAYLTAVSAIALCVGLAACVEPPKPVPPAAVAAAPAPVPQLPPPQPSPAPAQNDAPQAKPTVGVEQSVLPPPPGAKVAPPKKKSGAGALLDRSLFEGGATALRAEWRGGDARLYLVAHKKKSKAAPKGDASEEQTVTIGKGDSLASIAKAHGTTVAALAKANGLKSPYRLTAGKTLKLPAAAASDAAPAEPKAKGSAKTAEAPKTPEPVTVAKGDTLASISRKSGVSVDDLASLNGLKKPYRLKIGQTLMLKAAAEEPASDTPKSGKTPAKGKKAKDADIGDLASASAATSTITVRRHDTIQSLAKQAHVSVAELARLNHIKKPYRLKPGQSIKLPDLPGAASSRASAAPDEPPAGPTFVTVGKHDTLASIARAHGTSSEALIKLNHLKKPYKVRRGQKLKLPARPPEEHTAQTSYQVQSGDSLYSIARRFGTDAKTLAEANGMDVGDQLKVGRRIQLPSGAEDKIAPRSGRVTSTVPAAPVPYSSLAPFGAPPPAPSSAPSAPSAPSSPPPSDRAVSSYRPSAPPAEAVTADDAEVAAAGKGLFLWPVKGDILQRFGPLAGGQRNDGVDIAGNAGDPVIAAASGEVVYAGNSVPGFGNLVLIRHDGGWVTAYAHLKSLDVKMRQTVTQGQTIGQVGQTGGVSQPQLHFEVRYAPSTKDKARPIDPMLVLPQ